MCSCPEYSEKEHSVITSQNRRFFSGGNYLLPAAFAAMFALAALGVFTAHAAKLPTGYTECTWISVTNKAQYIDTGYLPKLTTDIQAHFEVPDFASQNVLYWTRASASQKPYGFIIQAKSGQNKRKQVRAYRMSTSPSETLTLDESISSTDIQLATEYEEGVCNRFTINGQTKDFAVAHTDPPGRSIYIFRLNDNGNVNVDARVGLRLYSFKILEEGVLQMDFVPCRNADGVAGLYDIKGGKFYTNAGAGGSFGCLVKAPGGSLPAGYTEVEYIQGNGTDTRIDTDYTPSPNTDKIEAVVEFPKADKTMFVWCARGDSTTDETYSMLLYNFSGYKLRGDYNASASNGYLTPAVTTDVKYTVTADGSSFTWSGGEGYSYQSAAGLLAGGPVSLFASYQSGIGNNLNNYGSHKLYSFKVWRSGELIHYFVPCKDPSDNATMVDICANPATLTRYGTFAAGPEGHYYDKSLFPRESSGLTIFVL